MRRPWLYAVIAALLAVGCAVNPSPSGTPVSSGAARLIVTGSGELCGPWWMGCGAFLAVEPPGWRVPEGWAPSDDDTRFAAFPRGGDDGPVRVSGVMPGGQDRIEPGQYRLVVIETRTPDNASPGTWYGSFGCAADVTVPPGTRAVVADVIFELSCTIAVSLDVPTPDPSS